MTTETVTDWSKPQPVSRIDAAFGGDMRRLLPKEDDIPKDFRRHEGTKWNKIQARWFFFGLPKETKFVPKEGIETAVALNHLGTIQRSFEPRHQHKEAAVAWLMSLWFEDVIAPDVTPEDIKRARGE